MKNARADKKQDFHECYCHNIYCVVSRKVKKVSYILLERLSVS